MLNLETKNSFHQQICETSFKKWSKSQKKNTPLFSEMRSSSLIGVFLSFMKLAVLLKEFSSTAYGSFHGKLRYGSLILDPSGFQIQSVTDKSSQL